MEYILYTILHVAFYATAGFALCGYMYLFTWRYFDDVSCLSFCALIMPTFAAVCAWLLSWALGIIAPIKFKLLVLIFDVLVLFGVTLLTWIFSIRKYRDEDCYAEFPTFFIVTGYSFAVLLGSAAFIFLS